MFELSVFKKQIDEYISFIDSSRNMMLECEKCPFSESSCERIYHCTNFTGRHNIPNSLHICGERINFLLRENGYTEQIDLSGRNCCSDRDYYYFLKNLKKIKANNLEIE